MTAVRYATITSILAPKQEVKINITGKYVMVYEASHSDFKARFGDNGQLQPWAKGIVIGDREDPVPFEEMVLVNTSVDEVLTITLAYGHGQIRDARTSLTGGDMPVIFNGAQPVTVESFPELQSVAFPEAQPVLVGNFPALQSVAFPEAQPVLVGNFPTIQNVQQAPVSFGAETHNATYSATTEIISAASNSNGLILRTALLVYTGSSEYHLTAGTDVLLVAGFSKIPAINIPSQLLIPPATPINILRVGSGSGARVYMTWDYL